MANSLGLNRLQLGILVSLAIVTGYINVYSIPAGVALVLKIIVLRQFKTPSVDPAKALLLQALIFAFLLQNLAELLGYFYNGPLDGVIQLIPGYAYFAFSILCAAVLVQFTYVLAFSKTSRLLLIVIYGPALLLELLLLFTSDLIVGFRQADYTFTRVPGSSYWIFTVYVILYLSTALCLLTYTARNAIENRKKMARLMLRGLAPFAVYVILVVALQHFGLNWISTPVVLPFLTTYFLFVTIQAVNDYKIFALSIDVPNPSVFAEQIQVKFNHLMGQENAHQLLGFLADISQRPVAIISSASVINIRNAAHLLSIPIQPLKSLNNPLILNNGATFYGANVILPYHDGTRSIWVVLGVAGKAPTIDHDVSRQLIADFEIALSANTQFINEKNTKALEVLQQKWIRRDDDLHDINCQIEMLKQKQKQKHRNDNGLD